MSWNEIVSLITVPPAKKDEAGYPIDMKDQETKREVYAKKKSIKRSEFYAANQNGIKADIAFIIRIFEYEGEQLLEHNGKRYKIIRSYETSSEMIELTCSDKSVGS